MSAIITYITETLYGKPPEPLHDVKWTAEYLAALRTKVAKAAAGGKYQRHVGVSC